MKKDFPQNGPRRLWPGHVTLSSGDDPGRALLSRGHIHAGAAGAAEWCPMITAKKEQPCR
jgi:hypothetical protein